MASLEGFLRRKGEAGQPLACVAVSPNPAISAEPAHGESEGKENSKGTPRQYRKVLLVIRVRSGPTALTHALLWCQVAYCGKRRPVFGDRSNQCTSHGTASVSVFLQEFIKS